jgi:hypothetical protein
MECLVWPKRRKWVFTGKYFALNDDVADDCSCTCSWRVHYTHYKPVREVAAEARGPSAHDQSAVTSGAVYMTALTKVAERILAVFARCSLLLQLWEYCQICDLLIICILRFILLLVETHLHNVAYCRAAAYGQGTQQKTTNCPDLLRRNTLCRISSAVEWRGIYERRLCRAVK